MPLQFNSYSVALLISLILFGCKSDVPPFELVEQDPKVVLHYSLVNNGDEIGVGDAFKDNDGWILSLSTLKFYLSDIALIEGGELTEISEVELVDIAGQGNENGFTNAYTYIIPKGDYDQLKMSVGLRSDLNSTDPTLMAADNPLSLQGGMYWDWATMFVFTMMEAKVDTNGDQQLDETIAFHTGLDSCFRPEETYPLVFNLPAFAKDTIHIDIDWNKLMYPESGEQIDLSTLPFFHANVDDEALQASRVFTDNFVNAISIREQ